MAVIATPPPRKLRKPTLLLLALWGVLGLALVSSSLLAVLIMQGQPNILEFGPLEVAIVPRSMFPALPPPAARPSLHAGPPSYMTFSSLRAGQSCTQLVDGRLGEGIFVVSYCH